MLRKMFIGAVAMAAGVGLATSPASANVGGAPDAGEHPYVGQLFFYVPDAVDPRFDEPGGTNRGLTTSTSSQPSPNMMTGLRKRR